MSAFRFLSYVDWLAVSYLGGTGGLLLLGWSEGGIYQAGALLHFGLILALLLVKSEASHPAPVRWMRETYPLFLLLLFYGEVDLFVKILHDPPGYDALVRTWDVMVFGGHPHQFLPQWLSGRIWVELFHLLYLSYYGLLGGAFVFVWSRHPQAFKRFAFVVTGMFVSFMGMFILFPVVGPLADPGTSIMNSGWGPTLVAWLYAPLQMNGIATGAFPSSHVGMSVGVVCLLQPRRRGTRWLLWVLVVGIAVSTVYGQFHYGIDAIAGGLAGIALYKGWSSLYAILGGPLEIGDVDQRESDRLASRVE